MLPDELESELVDEPPSEPPDVVDDEDVPDVLDLPPRESVL